MGKRGTPAKARETSEKKAKTEDTPSVLNMLQASAGSQMIDASLHPFESWKKRVVRESRAYYAGRGEPWFLSLWERAKQCANHPLSADFIARNSKQGKTSWCWNPKEYCDKFDAYVAHGGNMAESPPVNVKVETKVKVECPAVKADSDANVEASAVKSEPPIEDPTGQCGPEAAETLPAPGLSEVQGTLALPNPNGGKQADIPGPQKETFPDSGLSQVQDALALACPNGNGNDADPSAQGAQAAPPANEDVAMAMTQPQPVSDLDVDEQGDAADAAPSAAEGLVSPKEASGDDAAALSPEVPSCAKEAGCDVAAGSTLSKEANGEGTPSVEVSTSMPCAAVSAPTEASADAMLNEPVVAMTQIEESEETLPRQQMCLRSLPFPVRMLRMLQNVMVMMLLWHLVLLMFQLRPMRMRMRIPSYIAKFESTETTRSFSSTGTKWIQMQKRLSKKKTLPGVRSQETLWLMSKTLSNSWLPTSLLRWAKWLLSLR